MVLAVVLEVIGAYAFADVGFGLYLDLPGGYVPALHLALLHLDALVYLFFNLVSNMALNF